MALPECKDFLANQYGGDVDAEAILGRWRRHDQIIGVNLKRNNNSSMGYSNGKEIFIGAVMARHCSWVFMHETTHCIAGGEVFAYPCGYWFGNSANMKLADFAVIDPNAIRLPDSFEDISFPYKVDTSESYANGDVLRETRKNSKGQIVTTFYGYQAAPDHADQRVKSVSVECDGAGVPNGRIVEFYPNGQIKEEQAYAHGNLSGKVIRRSETGKLLFEANYVDGLLDGTVVRFHLNKDGEPVKIYSSEYKANARQGITEKYHDGKLVSRENYKDGKLDGRRERYDISRSGESILVKATSYAAGKKEGVDETFYPNGKPSRREYYKNDLKDGMSETFDKDGNKTGATEFHLGKPLK
jgi:antitoxin component YwqK of YwqJK toxin-antitoxin module